MSGLLTKVSLNSEKVSRKGRKPTICWHQNMQRYLWSGMVLGWEVLYLKMGVEHHQWMVRSIVKFYQSSSLRIRAVSKCFASTGWSTSSYIRINQKLDARKLQSSFVMALLALGIFGILSKILLKQKFQKKDLRIHGANTRKSKFGDAANEVYIILSRVISKKEIK